MDWKKTLLKTLRSALIAAGVIVVGAILEGLKVYVPNNPTEAFIWQLCGAGLIGLVTGALNWLKHKDDPNS